MCQRTRVVGGDVITARHLSSYLVGLSACLGVLLTAGRAKAEERAAAPAPEVHLYTMGVGQALFERFGHAAICLHQPRRASEDLCFNYGTADFQTPVPLTWSFLRGRAEFWVATMTRRTMMAHYRTIDRTVWRQVLPLTDEQARAVARRLLHDAQPENRYFTYHHFDDNCTTRLRDLIDEATHGRLREGSDDRMPFTYRDVVRRGFAADTWLVVSSDLFLGRASDVAPTRWQAMFLPEVFRAEVARRFEAPPVVLYARRGPPIDTNDPGWAVRLWLVLIGLLLTVPVLLAFKWRRWEQTLVAFPATALGSIGLLLWAVAVVSPLPELRWNEALLLFIPIDLSLPFISRRWRRRLAGVRLAIVGVAALLLAVGVLRSPLWAAMVMVAVPLIGCAGLRSPPPGPLRGPTSPGRGGIRRGLSS